MEKLDKIITYILIVKRNHELGSVKVKFRKLDETTQLVFVSYKINDNKFEYTYTFNIDSKTEHNNFLFSFNRAVRNNKNNLRGDKIGKEIYS